ncbi:MAG: polyprenol monophosphomannose synthase [Candidatus Peribacteraceae bacterium]|nr:polyprenol monophosphomannose synthase [Candidatus Peribacteraceae bacterium]MDD5740248.1 polyprenol monophosphomannose synthase [Candidatus Peribacteraceae bacterium]
MHNIRFVSVILPTYNEAGNIVALVEAIDRAITLPHEIIVVDDNSPDGTSRLVREMIGAGRMPTLRLETRMTDRGLTKSLWRGIELAHGDTIVWMDCDFSMPPEKIPALLAKIGEGFDIAVGSRFAQGGSAKQGTLYAPNESFLATVLSRGLNVALRLVLTPRFRDYTSGFIAVRREVFRSIRLTGDYGEYFMDLMQRAMLMGFSFVEVPYINALRRSGESKTAPNFRVLFKRGLKYLAMILRLWGLKLKHLAGGSIKDRDALPPSL